MSTNRSNTGALVGGAVLIALGVLSLAGQFFTRLDFWGMAWPFFIIGFGALFFVGMFAGGKSVSGLAIPGTIIMTVGLMLFLQNLFNYWQSWAYGWTLILISVGLGIFIAGWYGDNEGERRGGISVMKIGAVLFLIFGGFFEAIFNSFSFSKFIFPVALILLGLYLVGVKSNTLRRGEEKPEEITPVPPTS
jgi:hypothetical protein